MSWERVFEEIFDEIDETVADVWRARVRRFGAYTARAAGVVRTFRRLQIVPDWYPEGALDWARRVSSPILDVIPDGRMHMAVTSHDGVPELAMVLGRIWDERVEPMTVWLRAYLDRAPGRLEVGATRSIKISVGADAGWRGADELAELDESVPDGAAVVESGDVRLGSASASELVALASAVEAELNALWSALNTHVHTSSAPGVPTGPAITPPSGTTPPAPPAGSGALPTSAGSVGATKVKAE